MDPASRPEESDSPQYEAFWFAVAQPRTAYDEHSGAPAFTIEPGGWVLALEDRGHEFLVQDTDGKVGGSPGAQQHRTRLSRTRGHR